MRKPEYHKRDEIGENHYRSVSAIFGVFSILIIISIWTFITAFGLIGFYLLLRKWTHSFIDYLGFVFLTTGVFAMIKGLESYFRPSTLNVRFESDHIVCKNLFIYKRVVYFDDIERVIFKDSKWFREIYVYLKGSDHEVARLNPSIYAYGEMVERILKHLNNITVLDLQKFPDSWEHWKKEPDWGLINQAIARAEENKSKTKENEDELLK